MGADGIAPGDPFRVVFFGTYDTHRPRFRVLRDGLASLGDTVYECHVSVWGGVEDRSHLRTVGGYVGPMVRWLAAVPRLMRAYREIPSHDAVIVPYLGQADAIIARRLTRRRHVPLVFDPYVSLHETVIDDRQMLASRSPLARLLRGMDRTAFKASDAILVDTGSHGDLMSEILGMALPCRHRVPVGAEPGLFRPMPLPPPVRPMNVLFYGSMIPLHGIETIIRAVRELASSGNVRFTVIGTGQDHQKARSLATRLDVDHVVTWIDRVPYGELSHQIAQAHVCLGIFGTSRKAQVVIPNKVFQALAVGRPVISADTRAMREWFVDGVNSVLVPPGDPHALADAIQRVVDDGVLQENLAHEGHQLFSRAFTPSAIGTAAHEALGSSMGPRWRAP